MARQTVLLVYGGESAERETSVRSARSVFAAMDGEKYEAQLCYIDPHGKWWILDHWTDNLEEHGGSQLVAALGSHSFLVLPGNALLKPDVIMPLLVAAEDNDAVAGMSRLLHMAVVAPSSGVSAATRRVGGLLQKLQAKDIDVDLAIDSEPDERIVMAAVGRQKDGVFSVAASIVDSESPDDSLRSVTDSARTERVHDIAQACYDVAHIRTCALMTFHRHGETITLATIDIYPDLGTTGTFLKLWRMSGVRYPEVVELLIATARK